MKNIRPTPKVPLLLVGPPGIGKTQGIEARFDHVEKLLLSSCVEEDIGGIPWRDGQVARRTKPDWLERLELAADRGQTVCLFLDEIDKARRSVADTLLTLVGSRTVGEFRLPESVCIVAAANPTGAGGGAESLSQPMLNRLCVIDVVPDLPSWAAWAESKFQSSGARAVVAAVMDGRVPLYETHGEGMDLRTTSPRSLALAMALAESGEVDDRTLRGLLTAGAASAVSLALARHGHEVLETSVGIVRRAGRSATTTVLRM